MALGIHLPHPSYLDNLRRFSRDAWLYLAFTFFSSVATGVTGVLLGLYILSLGYRENFLGTMESMVTLMAALLAIPAGIAVDSMGPRRALIFAAWLSLGGRVGQVFLPDSTFILTSSALLGGGTAFVFTAGDVFKTAVTTPRERPHLFGLHWALFTGSAVLGSLAGGLLPSLLNDLLGTGLDSSATYRLALVVAIVCLSLALIPVYAMRRERASARSDGQRPKWYRVAQPKLVARLVAPQALLGAALGLTYPFTSVFFKNRLEASTVNIGLILSIYALTGILAGVISPLLVERFGKVRTAAALMLASAPAFVLIGYVPSLWIAAGALWLRGLFLNASWPVLGNFAMEAVTADQRGRVNALMNVFWNVSWTTTALLAGWIMSRNDYSLPYFLAFLCFFGGASLYFAFFRRVEQD